MHIEAIKLSPKKGGNGYTSSYSFSIGSKEAAACGLIGKRLIKIIDEEKGSVSFKAKHFTVNQEIIDQVIRLKEIEQAEDDQIARKYATRFDESSSGETIEDWSLGDMFRLKMDEVEGNVVRPDYQRLEKYLLSLPIETLADLTLLMYIGRDPIVDMDTDPGEERFLQCYDDFKYIVLGVDADTLVDILLEKAPLIKYLKTGVAILSAPKGSDVDDLLYGPKENEYEDY